MAGPTPYQWYAEQLSRALLITIDGVPGAMAESPELAVTFLLMPMDGLRALAAYCLSAGGDMVILRSDQNANESHHTEPA